MTVLDLFSGIGGISLGLERTGGFKTIGFCEIEPFPREVLRKHWPEVPIHDDVRRLTASALGGLRPDCIVGGFPCQDISVAGKGAGLAGARSGLWAEYARLVGELRPRWVLAENVGALRTRGVDRVCSDLESEGYAVWPLLVGAWAAGAPHKRERVWIVARLAQSDSRGGRAEDRNAKDEGRPAQARRAVVSERRAAPAGDSRATGGNRPTASGVGLADRHGDGQHRQRCGGVLDGERAASRHDADGRCERPVGEPTGSGLEGQRADTGEPQEPESGYAGAQLPQSEGERRAQQGHGRDAGSRLGCDGPCWPARPGEPQHEWEAPRLMDYAARGGRQTDRVPTIQREQGSPDGGSSSRSWSRRPQLPLGGAAHGLPERLVRRANREALKALGNSVVPQVVEAIGYAILAAEAEVGA